MVKLCVVETARGIKLSGGKVINNGKPVMLAGREIFSLFSKKVKVYELVDGKKVRLTPENYLDNLGTTEVIVEEDDIDPDVDPDAGDGAGTGEDLDDTTGLGEDDAAKEPAGDSKEGSEETTEELKADAPAENETLQTTETEATGEAVVENTEETVENATENTEAAAENVEAEDAEDHTEIVEEEKTTEEAEAPATEVKVTPVPRQQQQQIRRRNNR